ncbi:glycoside hydrolase domain-containing protein [Saccharopolyspora shandongensis]|uniref:glycoside hydrolase domain-containing protein n=1 Tax=Saccharopolyspora shandongensis TaxID=418495 RepID=UPI00343CFFB7
MTSRNHPPSSGRGRQNPDNEPDLHSPWMYSLVGQPAKTSAVVRAQQTLFTNAADGSKLQYIDEVRISGTPQEKVSADLERLRSGGTIEHRLADRPGDWATGPDAAPASPCAAP